METDRIPLPTPWKAPVDRSSSATAQDAGLQAPLVRLPQDVMASNADPWGPVTQYEMLVLDAPKDTPRATFVDFQKGATSIGSLRENATGGLVLDSTGGDVAEFHEVADDGLSNPFNEGDVVSDWIRSVSI